MEHQNDSMYSIGELFPVLAAAAGKMAAYDGSEVVDLAGNRESYGERLVTGGRACIQGLWRIWNRYFLLSRLEAEMMKMREPRKSRGRALKW